MKKLTKMTGIALLVSGLIVAGTTMAGPPPRTVGPVVSVTVPTLNVTPNPATVAISGTVATSIATTNTLGGGNTATSLTLNTPKTLAGTVVCTTAAPFTCTYTHLGKGTVKVDNYKYTLAYTDANKVAKTLSGTVVVNITLPAASQ